MNLYCNLAQKSIEFYLKNKKILPMPLNLPHDFQNKKAGVFVSLHNKKDGQLRGCIGTIMPTQKNIAWEIINNAVSAACFDPRFEPLDLSELKNLNISVDILSEPEAVDGENSLNPKKYGVIVKNQDGKTGLLLPNLPNINDASLQVAIAKQKAGILLEENCFLYRFMVERHTDKS